VVLVSDRQHKSPYRKGTAPARQRRVAVVAALAAVGVAVGSTVPAPLANALSSPDVVQQDLDSLVRDNGFPAALASVRGRDGHTRDLTAGVGDLTTKARVPVDGQVRIGSNTKVFTSVVVLQLVGEGKVDLDAPVETYLPNLVRGDGIDGREITVRQLLQHTSGLPNYTDYLGTDAFEFQHTYTEPRELLDLALAHKADFAPGTSWAYSNTNYLLAGLIVQKVTGRPIGEEITTRVINRVGLRHTYFPGIGDQSIRERHPEGYFAVPGQALREVTEMDPSWGWAAGQMIATPSDLNRFLSALIGGKLLAPAQLAEMRTTVDASAMWPGARYGLGLVSTPLSCGGLAWGHGGDIPGYSTRDAVTEDGRAATVAVTSLLTDEATNQRIVSTIDDALCN
jgi:D-alanyl-D-alanine carboxypeptidase